MKWYYTIDKGLSSNDGNLDILFGMTRDNLRILLSYNPEVNKGRFDSEDSYRNLFNVPNHYIRLGFKIDLLFEIEVLDGTIIFDGVTIQTQANLDKTLTHLKAKGHIFQEWDYGYIDRISKIDLGDSTKNGGVENLIYWILISEDLNHLD